MSRNLLLRILVAAVFGPAIIYVCYRGGYWLLGMLVLFAAIGIGEFLWNIRIRLSSPLFWLAMLFAIAIVAVSIELGFRVGYILLTGYFLCAGMLLAVRNESPAELFRRNAIILWGVAYVGLLFPFVAYIRNVSAEYGGHWLLFLFGTLWLSDTLAMGIGKNLGRRKFAPTVSPDKTVEGFLGGILGGLIVAIIMHFWLLSGTGFLSLLIAGLLVSIVGQLGDLVESCWKRSFDIKDSSAIIPGHGGVLDRFDSLLFASPVLFWFLQFILYR
ncbi:MAG: phosphatidate cytidylyltransferase [Candidatus Zixiibacteriota bacterium]|nr:MAG: phosphatidate cytidylyltransferase [candidate division Zixibacteria bacterium]